MDQERIVAVGLLTRRELELLGPTFSRVWPVEEAPGFSELLRAIDEADQQLKSARNRSNAGRAQRAAANDRPKTH
jgi:hypothetical protein